jgi:hypothetical protein
MAKHMAQWISQIGSPPLTTLVGAAFLFYVVPVSWMGFLLFACFSVVIPLVYVWWLLRCGKIGDMHMMHRHERHKPLMMACLSNGVGLGMLHWGDFAIAFQWFALVQCVITLLFLIITPWFKISLHSASAGVLFLLSVHLSDYVVAPVIMLGLICWSRIFLKRHTSTQVLAGCVIGGLVWIWVGP